MFYFHFATGPLKDLPHKKDTRKITSEFTGTGIILYYLRSQS